MRATGCAVSGLIVTAVLSGLAGCSALTSEGSEPAASTILAGVTAPIAPFEGSAPFRLEQNSIQVRATLAGEARERTFVLDSGAPMTISSRLADDLSLATATEVLLLGPDGGASESARVVRIPTVTVADQDFANVGAVVDWVQAPNPVACLSTDGLLGASLLRAAVWQIDFHTGLLTVTDQITGLPGLEYAMRIPFRPGDSAGSPRIEVPLNPEEAGSLLIDLGFNGSVALPVALYEQAGGTLAGHTPAQTGTGAGTVLGDAPATTYIGTLPELSIGDLRLPDFPVLTGKDVSDFHVGIAFLRHFRVTIDWKTNELYLQRRDPETSLYRDYTAFGFTPQLENGQVHVGALWRNGPAARAGLRIGDQIISVDGRSLQSVDFATLCSLLDAVGLFGSHADPIDVTFLRGTVPATLTVRREALWSRPNGESSAPSR